MALDLSAEIARLRSLSVPSPPSWTTGNGLPRVVAALDVAWGKTRDANGTGGEEEVAVAVAAGFALDGARGGSLGAAPLFVEFEPREGVLRGPFPAYEAGKLFSREGPLLVPLMKRVIEKSAAAAAAEARATEREEGERGDGGGEEGDSPQFPTVGLWLVDGFGELHPERFGCACALGAAAGGAPTAGVAKSMLSLRGGASPSEKEARRGGGGGGGGGVGGGGGDGGRGFLECLSSPGMETWPIGDDGGGFPLAVAMRPSGRSGGGEGGGGGGEESSLPSPTSPPGRAAFVSAGHRVPLPAAARAVLACYDPMRRYRLPEPSRAADRLARQRLREALLPRG